MRKLFKPYRSRGHTLEETLAWIHAEGAKLQVRPEVIEAAIRETFLEMANGLAFSKNVPIDEPGGFGPEFPHGAMNLYLKTKMINLNQKFMEEYTDIIERSLNASIRQYEIGKRRNLTNWQKSGVLRGIKKGAGKLKHGA